MAGKKKKKLGGIMVSEENLAQVWLVSTAPFFYSFSLNKGTQTHTARVTLSS